MADQLSATKRKNLLAGWAADAIGAVDSFARAPFGYSNPPVQAISNLLGVPGLQRTLDRVSYGEPLTTGKGQATRLRDDTVDALGFVPMSPKAALAVASNGLAGGAEKAIFAGVKAKNAPLNMLERAQALEASGADPRKVWTDTGWMKGGDGKWRFEIDDSGAKLNRTRTTNPEHFIDLFDEAAGRATGVSMGNALDHAALYQAYPDTQALRFTVGGKEGGSLSGNTVRISDPWEAAIGSPGSNPESTTLHELQHAIQEREGFAKGGNPESMKPLMAERSDIKARFDRALDQFMTTSDPVAKSNAQQEMEFYGLRLGKLPKVDSAQDAYMKLAGEAEARAVQARMLMTPEQRRATFPLDSYDVDPASLIYRMGSNGPALATVWHGTPHKFDKFDSSKIGTGEGAQAYGHGLYLAESPDVAKQYAGDLAAARASRPIGNVDLATAYQNMPSDVPQSLLAARRDFRALNDMGELSLSDRRDFLEAVRNNIAGAQSGNLYKVDLPDEAIARMLDWDKPLSQQSQEVQQAIMASDHPMARYWAGKSAENPAYNGEDLYTRLGGAGTKADATNALKQMGIPGIRYLDGGSRGTGQGTSNFVVFPGEENMLQILERNGQPIK